MYNCSMWIYRCSMWYSLIILLQVKAECPLCKQVFRSIIHNVKSNNQYEEYMVDQQLPDPEDITERRSEYDSMVAANRRFRYRYCSCCYCISLYVKIFIILFNILLYMNILCYQLIDRQCTAKTKEITNL